MKTFHAAIIQMQGTLDPEANLKRLEEGVAEAASLGAHLVCAPELCCFWGAIRKLKDGASSIPGPVTERLADMARKHSVTLAPGSIPEATDGHPYNTSLLYAPDGRLLGSYRKRHLFRVSIPGTVEYDERESLSAGENPPALVETDLGRLGLSICYDLRFPEHYLQLALDGAEVILAPSAFTHATGQAHWHTLCRARAIETSCFLLAPNQLGQTPPAPRSYGHSLIIDPWGYILAEAGEEEYEVIHAELDAQALITARQKLHSLEHREPGDAVKG